MDRIGMVVLTGKVLLGGPGGSRVGLRAWDYWKATSRTLGGVVDGKADLAHQCHCLVFVDCGMTLGYYPGGFRQKTLQES